ncbi:hypothetical protein K1719_011058 [Acacia pycnantha]|nr:hypothetical protein K1719_011058 [Acacia pycnantha]
MTEEGGEEEGDGENDSEHEGGDESMPEEGGEEEGDDDHEGRDDSSRNEEPAKGRDGDEVKGDHVCGGTAPDAQVDEALCVTYYRLEDIWLNDNRIESLEEIGEAVTGSTEKLKTIHVYGHP